MAGPIFIDASAWVALIDRHDSLHSTVVNFYAQLLHQWPVWITKNLVVSETYLLVRQRVGYEAAVRFLMILQSTTKLIKVYSDQELESQAAVILRQYKDQDFSYVDAVSFAVMQQRNISDVFTFDHHFSVAGFNRVIYATQ